ncbi:MAG: TetR/AcrR family transcriptional regulator [Bacteroidota bacterium]
MPRGRPPSFDRDEVLTRLLFLFWEKGYDGTSQSDMVERAGISSSSLYNAFGNKPDIFATVAKRYNQMMWAGLAPLREGAAGIRDVVAFFQGAADQTRAAQTPPGCLMVRTMTELGGRPQAPPAADRCTSTYQTQIVDAVRQALTRASDAREITPEEIEPKTQIVLTLMLGAMAVAVSNREAGAAMLENARALVEDWHNA